MYRVVCGQFYFQPICSNRCHQIYPTILNKKKLYKIYETMTFRHWTRADTEESFLKKRETSELTPRMTPEYWLEEIFRLQVRAGFFELRI